MKKLCNDFKQAELTADDLKCLIFAQGLVSAEDAEVRQRVLTKLENEQRLSLQKLAEDCQRVLYFNLFTRPKMPFMVMHRKEVTHSNGSYERKSRGWKLANEMGRAKKIPMVHYRVMHRKRVTSKLHDSYFRLMTIKHSISKIEWASNDYITQLSSTSQSNWVPVPVEFDAQGGAVGLPVEFQTVGEEMW